MSDHVDTTAPFAAQGAAVAKAQPRNNALTVYLGMLSGLPETMKKSYIAMKLAALAFAVITTLVNPLVPAAIDMLGLDRSVLNGLPAATLVFALLLQAQINLMFLPYTQKADQQDH